ncbi:hypothetical protein [Klebsiella michiganensis]|uniref:hypothetical protein n=1 Tax=Klebsiella michiganensis TaxID=1134687 RepID=UPI003D980666
MKTLAYLALSFSFVASSFAASAESVTNLRQVDGNFSASLNPAGGSQWLGQLRFKLMGSIEMKCDNTSIGGDDSGVLATYRCQNGYTAYLKKDAADSNPEFFLSSIDFQTGKESDVPGMKMRVIASPQLPKITDFQSINSEFDKKQKLANLSRSENTVGDACTTVIAAHTRAASYALTGDVNRNAVLDVSAFLTGLYPDKKTDMAAYIIKQYVNNKEQARLVSLPDSNNYLIRDCIESPDKYIPDFGNLVWSGTIFR